MWVLLLAVLTWRNSVLAKQKEQNAFLWGVYTIVAFFAAMFLGLLVVVICFCRDVVDLSKVNMVDEKSKNVLAHQLERYITDNPLQMITVYIFAFGGYLLVRYLLERKPGKKEPEVHWMDRMNDQL
jgi:hypothetical protein